jgi:hypothetical protein
MAPDYASADQAQTNDERHADVIRFPGASQGTPSMPANPGIVLGLYGFVPDFPV